MSSNSSFMSAGDLIKVRVSACYNLPGCSSSPYICNSQLLTKLSSNIRRTPSGSKLNCDRELHRKKASLRGHLPNSRRHRSLISPSAALHETVEACNLESPSAECDDSQSLIHNELTALDAYFNKLRSKSQLEQESSTPLDSHRKEDISVKDSFDATTAVSSTSKESQYDALVKDDLKSIELYLERLVKGSNSKQEPSSTDVEKSSRELENLIKDVVPRLQVTSAEEVSDEEFQPESDEPASLASPESSIVYIIAAINIAVYLFGLASPVDTSGMGTSTLPLLYGAKVNELLLNGEWWRLMTPMFLHAGFFHVVLSTWALLFFGPQVENVFGPLAFCMIYFLGGLCGNMCSFFFTPDATVGGTGPLFALFGAWVAYLWQNRKVLGENYADFGIKATTLMGILVLCLSCLLPTDEWIHVGAILPGALFGAFACPLLQVVVDGSDMRSKSINIKEGSTAMFDSPSALSLTLGFVTSMALCFALFYFLAPMVAESQLLVDSNSF